MKIANNIQYLNLVKDLVKVDEKSDKLPDSIAEAPDLSQPQKPESKLDNTKARSDSAKLNNAAQESLTRARIENQVGKNLDLNRLQNLKEQVKEIAPEIKNNHLERLIGVGTNTGSAKGVVDGIRDIANGSSRDRVGELTGGKIGDLRMVGGSLVSEDPKTEENKEGNKVESPSLKDIIINFFLGQASGRQQPIPLPPTPPDPETGTNMWNGVTFLKDVLGTGSYENHVNNRGGIDTNGTPNPEAPDTGGPHIITPEILIGIETKKNSKGEPNPESQDGSGGPINETKASGGATGPAGEPAMEVDRAVATSRDMDAIRIKLESKFLIG
ncbi:MAG TPA: hypothetical protein VLH08_11775 [Acidobacteriota bacterium]|nr:hypothetical protein [Acidobacteriota bacterium]